MNSWLEKDFFSALLSGPAVELRDFSFPSNSMVGTRWDGWIDIAYIKEKNSVSLKGKGEVKKRGRGK